MPTRNPQNHHAELIKETIMRNSLDEISRRLERIELMLEDLIEQPRQKEFYSTAEVAERVGRAEFTVREWCRNGRVRAEKEKYGRGRALEWRISHEELQRILNHGPLPLNQKRT